MVLLINGQQFDYPRKKPTGALEDFCAAILAARKSNPNVVPLEQRNTVHINGASADHLVVLQREVGAILGANRSELDKKMQEAATAGTVVVPMARKNCPKSIASIDATTCLIVAMSNPLTKDVAVAHVDSEAQARDGMVQMLRLINLNFQQAAAAAAAVKKGDEGDDGLTGEQATATAMPIVKLQMLGAVKWMEYSPDTLSAFIKTLIEEPKVCFDMGDGTDISVWSLNAAADGKIIKRGLMVDNNGGPGVPVECVDENRAYPAGKLRALRSFAQQDTLSSITLFRGEESIAVQEENSDDKAAAAASKAKKTAEEQLEVVKSTIPVFKVVVRPFKWRKFVQDASQRPLDFFLKLSGTPTMEPSDFAATVKASVIFANAFDPETVFGKEANRPTVFVATDAATWAKV